MICESLDGLHSNRLPNRLEAGGAAKSKEIRNGKTYHEVIHELRSANENMTATVSTDGMLSAAKHLPAFFWKESRFFGSA